MGTIRIIEQMSLDGVIQGPGGPDEDRDGGFANGGCAMGYGDPEFDKAVAAAHGERFDLLLGRRTYDIWSRAWPTATGPMADSLNTATKYVATHRPDSLGWGPVESLGDDAAAGVRRIKAGDGPDLILWGSSTLAALLISHDLADEILLFLFPVLVGRGKEILADCTDVRRLTLVRSRVGLSGVIISTWRPAGVFRVTAASS